MEEWLSCRGCARFCYTENGIQNKQTYRLSDAETMEKTPTLINRKAGTVSLWKLVATWNLGRQKNYRLSSGGK